MHDYPALTHTRVGMTSYLCVASIWYSQFNHNCIYATLPNTLDQTLLVCLWMRCPSQSSQSSVHLIACRSIWRLFPQSEVKGGGEGQERLVEYPGDLGVPWGAQHLRGPRCGWHQTTLCHAASPAGLTWQRAASFLSAAFTAACVKHMTSFSRAVRFFRRPYCFNLPSTPEAKVNKKDLMAHLFTVTVIKDIFLFLCLPAEQTTLSMAAAIDNFCRDIYFSFCVFFLCETQYQSWAFMIESLSTCCTSRDLNVRWGQPLCERHSSHLKLQGHPLI